MATTKSDQNSEDRNGTDDFIERERTPIPADSPVIDSDIEGDPLIDDGEVAARPVTVRDSEPIDVVSDGA